MRREVAVFHHVTRRFYTRSTSLTLLRYFHHLTGQCRLTKQKYSFNYYKWNNCNDRTRILALLLSKRSYFEPRKTIFSLLSSRKMATSPDSSSSSSKSTKPGDTKPSSSNNKVEPKFSASKEELKARLSPIQYQVTQLKSTERPFSGEYCKFNKKGVYHCVVCDEELFKSDTKFESGCGWPAFFDTTDKNRLKFVQDFALVGAGNLLLLAKNPDLVRTEVLCSNCDAHLGHRFDDGPISKGGKRYCINSAALRFVPLS